MTTADVSVAPIADVSVIIPAFRAARTVGRALRSVASQTLKPLEVVVVDDGSDDGTSAVAQACRSFLGGIELRLFRQDNQGAGAARNTALVRARGTYVAFLDADDEWLPVKLQRSLAAIERANADIVSHNYLLLDGKQERLIDCARHHRGGDAFVAQMLRGFIATSTVVARRALLIEIGGFDPGLRSAQDYELWLALVDRTDVGFEVFSDALTQYHVTQHSISSDIDLRRQASLNALERHIPRLRGRSAVPALVAILRCLIVHVQAAEAHLARGEHLSVCRDLARFLVALWRLAPDVCRLAPMERPNFLERDSVGPARTGGV